MYFVGEDNLIYRAWSNVDTNLSFSNSERKPVMVSNSQVQASSQISAVPEADHHRILLYVVKSDSDKISEIEDSVSSE